MGNLVVFLQQGQDVELMAKLATLARHPEYGCCGARPGASRPVNGGRCTLLLC
jgi:hypothetical protein